MDGIISENEIVRQKYNDMERIMQILNIRNIMLCSHRMSGAFEGHSYGYTNFNNNDNDNEETIVKVGFNPLSMDEMKV